MGTEKDLTMRKDKEFDPFADVENATRSVRGAYFDEPGKHVCEVDSV